ncbi:MAG: hypothetical protein AAB361_00070 [Patescibacteria group bacterium]
MNKKIIIISAAVLIILLIVAVLAVFLYKDSPKESSGEKILDSSDNAAKEITNSATKGVLPSLETNPLENKPDLNPAEKANPIKNIKTNPF